jgi:hypothetical protein
MEEKFRSGRLSYEERDAILTWLGEHAIAKFRRNLLYSMKRSEVFSNVFTYVYDIFTNSIAYSLNFETRMHAKIFMWIENGTGIFGASGRPITGTKYLPSKRRNNMLKFIGTNTWAGLTIFTMQVKGITPKYNYLKTVLYMQNNDSALRRQARRELRI